jgi:hypothetical protein
MSDLRADDLAAGYEALRARALGGLPAESARGMAVVLAQGLPAWIRAWTVPPSITPAKAPAPPASDAGLAGEVVRLLTEMVLGGERRLAIP